MKATLLSILLAFICLSLFAQFDRNSYQTQKTTIKVGVIADGEWYIVKNDDINLVLDYGVGNVQIRLKSKDFSNEKLVGSQPENNVNIDREYFIRGILPINEILNQSQIKGQYFIELNLSNTELGINHPVQFDLVVTSPNPGKNQSKYRMFSLHGRFYNSELKLPYFEGYEDEIEVWIKWTAYYIIG
jgi:hypothetical protein